MKEPDPQGPFLRLAIVFLFVALALMVILLAAMIGPTP